MRPGDSSSGRFDRGNKMDGKTQRGTMLLVVGRDGRCRTTTDAGSLQPGETMIGWGTAGDAQNPPRDQASHDASGRKG